MRRKEQQMAVLDFNKAKKKKPVIKVATKFMFIYRKLEQFVIDHDKITRNIDTLQGIQERVLTALDKKIKTVKDIDRLYYEALGVRRRCK